LVWYRLDDQCQLINILWIQLPPYKGNWVSVEDDDNILLHINDLMAIPPFPNLQ
jgi:hypothetical protein